MSCGENETVSQIDALPAPGFHRIYEDVHGVDLQRLVSILWERGATQYGRSYKTQA